MDLTSLKIPIPRFAPTATAHTITNINSLTNLNSLHFSPQNRSATTASRTPALRPPRPTAMSRPPRDVIVSFMAITGASEAVAVHLLEEHSGDLNRAINARFSERDRNVNQRSHHSTSPDFMNIDSPEDNFIFHSNHGRNASNDASHSQRPGSSAPFAGVSDSSNDIEAEMVKAAIEASKRETERVFDRNLRSQLASSTVADADLARALSLSLKTANEERRRHQQATGDQSASTAEHRGSGRSSLANGRQAFVQAAIGTSSQSNSVGRNPSVLNEIEEVDDQALVRRRSRRISQSRQAISQTSSSPYHDTETNSINNTRDFRIDEWDGISSEERDESVMLEAAMFSNMPGGSAFPSASLPYQANETGSRRISTSYPRRSHPPPPGLMEERLIREQQDDAYLAALQADQEKELKAKKEAELHRSEEVAAREAALIKQRQEQEEIRRKQLEEEELERKLAAKQASIPPEPSLDDENTVTLVVRMPDGSRRGRRFLKSDRLQLLYDYIDIGRVVKPGSYRLVRSYPRHTFTDREIRLSLRELGLTNRQEALFLEAI